MRMERTPWHLFEFFQRGRHRTLSLDNTDVTFSQRKRAA
jgi:hypothetical protein